MSPATRYALEPGTREHARLIRSSQRLAADVRDAMSRANLKKGDRVIEFGCGPLGALLPLAELVGPEGSVIGVDFSAPAVEQARAFIEIEGLKNVHVVHADYSKLRNDELPGGAFNVVYVRRFLMWQKDAVAALRCMAKFLRAGGRIVAHELFFGVGFPRFGPTNPPAVTRLTTLSQEFFAKTGISWDITHRYPQACSEAGLTLLGQRAFTEPSTPIEKIEEARAAFAASRRALLATRLATERELDEIDAGLGELIDRPFDSYWGELYGELIAAVP